MTRPRKKSQPPSKVRREWMKQGIAFAREMLLAFAAVLFINSFVMASFQVPTPSMEKTVMVGDHVLVNKFIYGGTTPYTIPFTSIRIPHLRMPGLRNVQRGDVIVFDWPGNRDQAEKPDQMFYLKRCIGLPGDTVRIDQRVVYVNGRPSPMPARSQFLRDRPFPAGLREASIFPDDAAYNEDNWGPVVIPRHGARIPLNLSNLKQWEVFISREGRRPGRGPSSVLIDGKPATEYTVARDYVFAMGDNRDNSLDSRFWGFVPVEDIIGTPMVVYWSWDPQIPFYQVPDKLLSIDLSRIGTIIR
jgi:signal peptidase I